MIFKCSDCNVFCSDGGFLYRKGRKYYYRSNWLCIDCIDKDSNWSEKERKERLRQLCKYRINMPDK